MFILDNTVLLNFARSNVVPLLKKLCEKQGATTLEVWDEFQAGIKNGYFSRTDLSWLTVLKRNKKQEEFLFQGYLNQRLDRGEASCLAVAISRKYSKYINDIH